MSRWPHAGETTSLRFNEFDETVVVDVETTGLSSQGDRIVAVAMLRIRFGSLLDNPPSHIPAEASKMYGITDQGRSRRRDVCRQGAGSA